jgi:hypothetical protein
MPVVYPPTSALAVDSPPPYARDAVFRALTDDSTEVLTLSPDTLNAKPFTLNPKPKP